MREIRFRGKDIKTGEWVYGDLIANNAALKNVCPDTIGQYTGLKDKNDKEIYEDDIVKAPYIDPIFGDIIKDAYENASIIFTDGSFAVKYSDKNIYLNSLLNHIEVIGNIHDNPELLEGGNK